MSNYTFLFVYGSLRKQGSHNHLMQDATWISYGYAKGTLFLIDWYPGMTIHQQDHSSEQKENMVVGDIYRISENLLSALDAYEGPTYDRLWIVVQDSNQNIHRVQTYIYNQNIENKKIISSADWLKYIETQPKPL